MVKPLQTQDMFSFRCVLNYDAGRISSKTGLVSLRLYVYISSESGRKHDFFPLKLRWPAKYVDLDRGRLIQRFPKDPDVQDYNMIIDGVIADYNEVAKKYRLANRNLTMDLFRRELKIGDSKKSLLAYMKLRRDELYRKKEISLQTWKNVGGTINEIALYQEDVTFAEINSEWMSGFVRHLKTKTIHSGEKEKKLSTGTIWARIKDLKAYLALAEKEVDIWVDKEAVLYPNPKQETYPIFLNREELRRLMLLLDHMLLTTTQHNVLRAFLFTCFTGLRISDVYRAEASWRISENVLLFTQRKNMDRRPTTVRIPLIPLARSFVNDVLSSFFDLPTVQEYNRTLKELAAMAEISKKLTSHSGRHTFGYLFMTTVGNLYALKKILGHKKISTTEKYAHLDEEHEFEMVNQITQGFEDLANTGRFRARPSIN